MLLTALIIFSERNLIETVFKSQDAIDTFVTGGTKLTHSYYSEYHMSN